MYTRSTIKRGPHVSTQDYIRDRSPTVSKSLYQNPDDWTDEPIYPEIAPHPNTPEGLRYIRRKEGDALAVLPTVRQKTDWFRYMPINLDVKPKHRGADSAQRWWQPFALTSFPKMYNATVMYQYLTRTSLRQGLPEHYYDYLSDAQVNTIVEKIRGPVIDALLTEKKYYFRNEDQIPIAEREMVKPAHNIADAIIRSIDLVCGVSFAHLEQLQIDLDAKVESHWRRSGYTDLNLNADCCHRRGGEALFQLKNQRVYRSFRHEQPLPEVVSRNSEIVVDSSIPVGGYRPNYCGLEKEEYIPRWLAGFNHGDPAEFCMLSVDVPKAWDDVLEEIGEESAMENLVASAVLGSFGRIVAQAAYLGFTILNELTYPIVTQCVQTTGRDWVFSLFQANTICVWKQDVDNPLQNVCWTSTPMRLFEEVNHDGVVGFNDEVLATFVKMYLKSPVANPSINLRPYLPLPAESYWKDEDAGVPFAVIRHVESKHLRKWGLQPEI